MFLVGFKTFFWPIIDPQTEAIWLTMEVPLSLMPVGGRTEKESCSCKHHNWTVVITMDREAYQTDELFISLMLSEIYRKCMV